MQLAQSVSVTGPVCSTTEIVPRRKNDMKKTLRRIAIPVATTLLSASIGNAQPLEIGANKWGSYLINKELSKRDGSSVTTTIGLIVSSQGKTSVGADVVHIQVRADCASRSIYLVNWKAVLRDGAIVATGGPASNVPDFADVTALTKPILGKLC